MGALRKLPSSYRSTVTLAAGVMPPASGALVVTTTLDAYFHCLEKTSLLARQALVNLLTLNRLIQVEEVGVSGDSVESLCYNNNLD